MKSPAFTAQIVIILALIIIGDVKTQRRRNRCRMGRGGPIGQCMRFGRCPFAMEQVRQNVYPEICRFRGREPIVCCPIFGENVDEPLVAIQPGTKSKQKCEEYTNIPLPVEQTHQLHTAVVGGIKALNKEFPHMAALGFGEENDIQWLCGATLISEEFVLTAAHCLYSQELGEVKFVRLGALNLKTSTDGVQDFQVASVHRNPEYTPPSQYNDIALVRLNRPASYTQYVRPACLQTEHDLTNEAAPIATGWGKLEYVGQTSDTLMKVVLSYFSNEECRKSFSNVSQRRLPNGITDESQLCAGGINESKDTCQGDSGGPLQIRSPTNYNQFYVIGVTSFGKGCGVANVPGVYTRVSNYISWIEEIVWPNL